MCTTNIGLLWSAICLSVVIGPIPWGHSGPLFHALSLLLLLWTSILHCHSPFVATVARRLRYSYSWLRLVLVVVSTVATPGEWQCKIRTGGVRRLAVANGPNIFQMLLVSSVKFRLVLPFCCHLTWVVPDKRPLNGCCCCCCCCINLFSIYVHYKIVHYKYVKSSILSDN